MQGGSRLATQGIGDYLGDYIPLELPVVNAVLKMNVKAWTRIMTLWIMDIICENQPPKGRNLYILQRFCYIV